MALPGTAMLSHKDRPWRHRRARASGFARDSRAANRSRGRLGDVIKHVTTAVSIKRCGGCEQRAKALNERVPFRRAT